MTTTAEINELATRLTDLLKLVQAGNAVLLTQGNKPVARLLPAPELETGTGVPLRIRSLRGHRVLAPVVSQAEVAEELFVH